MTQMRLYPRVASLTPADAIFIIDVGTDGSPNTKSIPGDKVLESLIGERINIGGTDTNSTDPVVNVNRAVDGTGTNGHCFSDSSQVNRAGVVAYNSFDARIDVAGTDNYDHFASFQSGPVYGTSGTIGIHYGLVDVPQISAGTITNRYGVYVADVTGAGAVTNNYGVYVPDQTKGGTKNLAICTAGATNHSAFEGSITIGSTAQANGTACIMAAATKAITTHYGIASQSSNTGNSVGFDAYNRTSGSGPMTLIMGVQCRPIHGSSGTCTTMYGNYIAPTNTGGGTITTCHGVYVAALPGSTSWGIYVAADNSYFGGDIVQNPSNSVTPANNGELVVEATNDTTLTFKLKGSDGTVRSGTLALS